MADLPKFLDSSKGKVKVWDTDLSCLIWADDIVLLSASEEGFTESLDILGQFCKGNK